MPLLLNILTAAALVWLVTSAVEVVHTTRHGQRSSTASTLVGLVGSEGLVVITLVAVQILALRLVVELVG